MGGGAFLLTEVAPWIPGRHEVRSRLALLHVLGLTPDESTRACIHLSDSDRVTVARRLADAWPRRAARRAESHSAVAPHRGRFSDTRSVRPGFATGSKSLLEAGTSVHETKTAAVGSIGDGPDWLHADRFSSRPPLLAVHLGAGNAAKRWPIESWRTLIDRFLSDGWRVVIVGGMEDVPLSSGLSLHDRLRDWTGSSDRHPDDGAARASRPFYWVRLWARASGGVGAYSFGHSLQRHQSAPAVAPLVAAFSCDAPSRGVPTVPPEGLPTRRSSVHGGSWPGPGLPWGHAIVVANSPGRVAALAYLA